MIPTYRFLMIAMYQICQKYQRLKGITANLHEICIGLTGQVLKFDTSTGPLTVVIICNSIRFFMLKNIPFSAKPTCMKTKSEYYDISKLRSSQQLSSGDSSN